MPVEINALDHLVVNVTDAENPRLRYERVLGERATRPWSGQPKRIAMIFGAQKINLRPVSTSKENGSPPIMKPPEATILLSTPSSPQQVVDHLKDCGIAIEVGPVERQGTGTLRRSLPRSDRSLIEISSYKQA